MQSSCLRQASNNVARGLRLSRQHTTLLPWQRSRGALHIRAAAVADRVVSFFMPTRWAYRDFALTRIATHTHHQKRSLNHRVNPELEADNQYCNIVSKYSPAFVRQRTLQNPKDALLVVVRACLPPSVLATACNLPVQLTLCPQPMCMQAQPCVLLQISLWLCLCLELCYATLVVVVVVVVVVVRI